MSSKMKHKAQATLIAVQAARDDYILGQLFEILRTGTDVERGTAAEVMKLVSQECPDRMAPYIDELIEFIDYKAPRVRWGCPESLRHLAKDYPDQVEKTILKLLAKLERPKHGSALVRGICFAGNFQIQPAKTIRAASLFQRFITTEQNNGVRKLYIKAIQEIARGR
jgi:hypothetical protein